MTNLYKKRNKELVNYDSKKLESGIKYVSLEHLKEEVKDDQEDNFIYNCVPTFSLEKVYSKSKTLLTPFSFQ